MCMHACIDNDTCTNREELIQSVHELLIRYIRSSEPTTQKVLFTHVYTVQIDFFTTSIKSDSRHAKNKNAWPKKQVPSLHTCTPRITILSAFIGIQRNLVRSDTAKAKNLIYKLYIIG